MPIRFPAPRYLGPADPYWQDRADRCNCWRAFFNGPHWKWKDKKCRIPIW